MPIPGTNIPLPWEPGGEPTAPTPDTSIRDAYIQQLAAEHKGQSGQPTQVNTKPTATQKATWTGFDLYTFGDGTTVEVSPGGQIQNLKLKGPQSGTVPSGWTNIKPVRDANGNTVYYGLDPSDSNPQTQYKPLPGNLVPGTTGTGARPVTPTGQLDRIDAQGRVIAPEDTTTAPAKLRDPSTGTVIDLPDPKQNAAPSGKYNPVTVTNADGSTRQVGMTDTGDNHFYPISADPTTNKKIFQTNTAVYAVDDNNNVTKLVDVDKSTPFQSVVIDGVPFRFDPNEKDPAKAFVRVGNEADLPHPPIRDGNNNPMQWDAAQGKYVYPPGVSAAATLAANTQAKKLEWYDANGNLVKSVDNPNYVGEKATVPTPNAVSPYILIQDPSKPGELKWIENKGQVTASDALKNLASQLSGQVVSGNITVDEAKTIIDASHNAMQDAAAQATQATTAAGHVLDYTRGNAQTGAGLLQQRAQSAQGMLNSILGLAQGGNRSGNFGGGMLSVPAGLGQDIVQGIGGWTAGLMGGQNTVDAASRMVQAASPGDMGSPESQTAIGVLTQMLDGYQQATGGIAHPIVQAHNAALQTQQNGGFTSPNPNPNPNPPPAPAPAPDNTPPPAPPPNLTADQIAQQFGATRGQFSYVPPGTPPPPAPPPQMTYVWPTGFRLPPQSAFVAPGVA